MKKNSPLKFLFIVPATSMAILPVVGCGTNKADDAIHVEKVEIQHFTTEKETEYYDKGQAYNYGYVGQKMQLGITVSPENATNKAVTWKVEDENIATIDQNGNVTPKNHGITTIEAVSGDGNKQHKIFFAVVEPTIEPTGIEFVTTPKGPIHHNQEWLIVASVLPVNAYQVVKWSSSDATVATIERDNEEYNKAKIKTLKASKTTIKAETYNGKSIEHTITVSDEKQKESVHVTSLSLDKNEIQQPVNLGPVQLNATVQPVDVTYKNVFWKIEDEDIATYDFVEHDNTQKIKIIPKKPGETKITCTTQGTTEGEKGGHLTETTTIKIIGEMIYAQSIIINNKDKDNKITIAENTGRKLSATVGPNNATDKGVKWQSSDPSVVEVDENSGYIHSKSTGFASISATALGKDPTSEEDIIDVCEVIVIVQKCNITLTHDRNGEVNKTSIQADIGTPFSKAIKDGDVKITPNKGYEFSHWENENRERIKDNYPVTSDFTAKAIFKEAPTLSIKTEPDLKTYVKGEYFDPIGLELKIKDKDGKERDVQRNEWTTDIPCNSILEKTGPQTVTVSLINNPLAKLTYEINVVKEATEEKCDDNHTNFGDIRVGFKLMSNHECVITEYENRKGNLLIPDYVYRNGKKYYIKNIKKNMFVNAKITGLDFHGEVDVDGTKIETQTRHLKVIGYKAFFRTNVLDHWTEHPQLILRFPEGLVEIGEGVFTETDLGQDKIGGYEFPSTIRKIDNRAIGESTPWIEGTGPNGGCLIFKCRKELVDIHEYAFWNITGRHYTHRIIGKSPDGNEQTSLEIAKSWATFLNDECSHAFHTNDFKTLLVPSTKE